MNIDHSQLEAIQHFKGPALVLAGPGSGKTTVITRRIQSLIYERKVLAREILVITFSKAAATEMKDRFYALTGGVRLPVTFGTFHAIYFQILRHAYGYTGEHIAKEENRVQFIREYIHRMKLEYNDENEFIQNLLSEISLVKNTMVDLQHYYSANCGQDVFHTIYHAYQEYLYQNNLIDFDDMLVYTKELFDQRPDILGQWQHRFRYILIDEFQDINSIQYDIIKMLARPENNLFIVGDDDQSIYQFRGSKPEIMLNFEKEFPDAKKYELSINYRSGKSIVETASNLISYNKKRFLKEIRASHEQGLPVTYGEFQDQREQNQYVIKEIQRLHQDGKLEYKNIAILFRTNMQPTLLIQQLMYQNIPYIAREHIPNVYEHWVAQDLFAYIRLAMGDRSRASFLKIMNRPKRYLSRESLPYESVAFDVWEEYYKRQDWMVQRLEKLQMDLKVLSRMRPYSAINYIRKGIAYEDYLKEFSEYRKLPLDDFLDVLDEIQEDAKEYDTYTAWFEHIQQYSNELKEQQMREKTPENGVSLYTLHSSKGLEFDTVFLVDVNENVMPYKKAVLDGEIEEERRMFYVGMTRAKERLYLLHSNKIRNKTMEPSRFIQECQIEKRNSSTV